MILFTVFYFVKRNSVALELLSVDFNMFNEVLKLFLGGGLALVSLNFWKLFVILNFTFAIEIGKKCLYIHIIKL